VLQLPGAKATASLPTEGGITSWDVLPSITSAGDISAHHFLAKPALRLMFYSSITSALGGLIPDVGEPMTVDLLIPVGV